jgi:arabinan endo-1,5-alpha-L-arabinosidase
MRQKMIDSLLSGALFGCVAMIFGLGASLPAKATAFSDHFEAGYLSGGWIVGPEHEHRNDRFWSLTRPREALTIVTQESDIHGDRNEPINYFLREVDCDDFEITTRVRFVPGENYEHAGLIVWQSVDDYIKLVHLFANERRLEGALEAGGRYSSQQIGNPFGDDLFLRIRKAGREYTFLFSGDGEEWDQLGSTVHASWENPKVGLFAVSPGSGRRIPASFDFFTVTALELLETQYAPAPESVPAEPGPGQVAVGFQNPVFLGDIPDPGIVRSGDWFYVVSTQTFLFGQDVGIPLLKSRDLVNWEFVRGMFTRDNLPKWVNPENPSLWAPDLIYREESGRYYLYFSAMGDIGFGIGVGWADHPEGGFTFKEEPLVIGTSFRNIDSQTFQDDDGALFMYWGSHGSLMVQNLSDDGLSLVGDLRHILLPQNSPVIIDADHGPSRQNENLIEAPWVIKRGGYYYMFYSGNAYYPHSYSTMVARATSPLGPFNKFGRNPILTTNQHSNAPGHNAVIQDDAGQDWIVYHAYTQSHIGFGRALLIDRIDWRNGWPEINNGKGPSHDWRKDGPILNLGPDHRPVRNIALGKRITASSENNGYPASHAIDGNTSTHWSPAGISKPQWLEIDLGSEYEVNRVQILFRSARSYISDPHRIHPGMGHIDQFYHYKIEYSLHGDFWRLYADRTDETFVAYPYIEYGEATARFVRLTITKCTSYSPNKNVYQIKIFGSPRSF